VNVGIYLGDGPSNWPGTLARDDAEFSGSVTIVDLGADTLVTIGGHSIMPVGVNGTGSNMITQHDFLLARSGSR
jgi:hypothetical protein